MEILNVLQQEFGISELHIKNIVELIDDGNTIPFIARYRKEMTGSCDDQKLRDINDRLTYLRNLEKRKEEVLSSIEEQGKLTEEISQAVANAVTLAEVEEAVSVGADIIMLDNMDNETMKQAVEIVGGKALLEASGNLTKERLRSVAELGVDILSIGALTHSVTAFDISMKIKK